MNAAAGPANDTSHLPSPAIEAEQSLLGAAMCEPEACVEALERVRPEHFSDPVHARMWEIIGSRSRRGLISDPITLQHEMSSDARLDEYGGLRFLMDLADKAMIWALPAHVEAVLDASTRRSLTALCRSVSQRAAAVADEPADRLLSDLEHGAAEIAHGSAAQSAWHSAAEITSSAIHTARNQKGMIGLSTGLTELDDAMGGLRRGQMIVVAGRPAMGKSTAGLQLAKAVAQQGRGAAFFSLEMPEFDLGLRMACDVAHNPLAVAYAGRSTNPSYFDAARGDLSPEQWEKLDEAEALIRTLPLAFDVRPGLTVANMLSAARRKMREWERAGVEPGCIVVDHLTIARADQDRRGNKVAEVGDISRGLAEMAKTLDVPVIALCQLSRDVEKRDKDKRPTLADLRWSGEIEQDARIVAFLYRPEYYVRPPETDSFEAQAEYREKLEPVRKKLFWLIEKNNNGPVRQVETYCDVACSAIRDRLGMDSCR